MAAASSLLAASACLLIASTAAVQLHGRTAPCGGAASMNFHDFVDRHSRTYDKEEFHMRQALFAERVAAVERHNCDQSHSWTAGINHMADWTPGELFGLRGYKHGAHPPNVMKPRGQVPSHFNKTRYAALSKFPRAMDWGNLSTIRKARDQGSCGSCWAFAGETVLRAHAEINGRPHKFSVSQVVSCVPNPENCGGHGGCDGATAELAFEYAFHHGLVDENEFSYPYGGGQKDCPSPMKTDPVSLKGVMAMTGNSLSASSASINQVMGGHAIGLVGWSRLPENQEEPIIAALVSEGPVAIAVAVGDEWHWYYHGIMSAKGCDKAWVVNHAVTLYGYGEALGKKFWHIKNSWGSDWGEDGNLRLQRHDDEADMCGWDHKPEDGSGCDGGPPKVRVCGSCAILYDASLPHFAPL